MSETVKLIIEIPKSALELLNTTGVDWLGAEHILSAVTEGIPLDDIKAEIKRMEYHMIDCDVLVSQDEVLEILDNIDKAGSEE